MARWIRDEVLNQPEDFVQFLMNDYLSKNGFKSKTRKGEAVWQSGDGFLLMARFVRYEYADGKLHLEAWIGKFKENPIKGFVGALPKKMFRDSLEELLHLLHQELSKETKTDAGSVVTVQVADQGAFALPALFLSIVGVVISLLIPILGVILGGLGLAIGQKARNSPKQNIAMAAVVLGVIAIVLGFAQIVFGAALLIHYIT